VHHSKFWPPMTGSGQTRSFAMSASMSGLPESGQSRAIFAGGSPGSRAGRCRAVIRPSRDPTRRTRPHSDGRHASDGGRVSAPVMRDLMRGCRQRQSADWSRAVIIKSRTAT